MTWEQFLEALRALEDRLRQIPGRAARGLLERIEQSRNLGPLVSDEQMARVHCRLMLVDLSHRVSRVECEAPLILGRRTHGRI